MVVSLEHFEDYIVSKAMPRYVQIHTEGEMFIDALTRGRFKRGIRGLMYLPVEERRQYYLNRLSNLLNKEH